MGCWSSHWPADVTRGSDAHRATRNVQYTIVEVSTTGCCQQVAVSRGGTGAVARVLAQQCRLPMESGERERERESGREGRAFAPTLMNATALLLSKSLIQVHWSCTGGPRQTEPFRTCSFVFRWNEWLLSFWIVRGYLMVSVGTPHRQHVAVGSTSATHRRHRRQ